MFVPLNRHWKLSGGEPLAVTLKPTLPPAGAILFIGWLRMDGGNEVDTVNTALLLISPGFGFAAFVTMTEYEPESVRDAFEITRVDVPCSNGTMVTPSRSQLYPMGGAPETKHLNITGCPKATV